MVERGWQDWKGVMDLRCKNRQEQRRCWRQSISRPWDLGPGWARDSSRNKEHRRKRRKNWKYERKKLLTTLVPVMQLKRTEVMLLRLDVLRLILCFQKRNQGKWSSKHFVIKSRQSKVLKFYNLWRRKGKVTVTYSTVATKLTQGWGYWRSRRPDQENRTLVQSTN